MLWQGAHQPFRDSVQISAGLEGNKGLLSLSMEKSGVCAKKSNQVVHVINTHKSNVAAELWWCSLRSV